MQRKDLKWRTANKHEIQKDIHTKKNEWKQSLKNTKKIQEQSQRTEKKEETLGKIHEDSER